MSLSSLSFGHCHCCDSITARAKGPAAIAFDIAVGQPISWLYSQFAGLRIQNEIETMMRRDYWCSHLSARWLQIGAQKLPIYQFGKFEADLKFSRSDDCSYKAISQQVVVWSPAADEHESACVFEATSGPAPATNRIDRARAREPSGTAKTASKLQHPVCV